MGRILMVYLLFGFALSCDAADEKRVDRAGRGTSRRDTIMVCSLPGRNYTRISDPSYINKEAVIFIKKSYARFDANAYRVSIVISNIPKNQKIEVYYLTPDRSKGWVVEMDTFAKPNSLRQALENDCQIPIGPDSGEPLLLLSCQDGTKLTLKDMDTTAIQYLKSKRPKFDPTDKHRVYRIYFREAFWSLFLGYLDEELNSGTAVSFREKSPLGHEDYEEPD